MADPQGSGPTPWGIVFSDLDGTLLDHETYDHGPAAPALRALRDQGVPLVLCSSKTRAEMLMLQERLGVTGPFIPENGGAVLLGGGGPWEALFPHRAAGLPAKVFGLRYEEIRAALVELRQAFRLHLRGFGDASLEEVSQWTGLGLPRASLAKDRDFDEPFLWQPEPAEAAVAQVRVWLAARGLQLTRGGRFWHLMGRNDKGRAVQWLLGAIAKVWGARPRSLALGDSENDLAMLVAADEGVLVERPGGGHLETRPPRVGVVAGVGPAGWNRGVLDWLERR